jgi:ribosomal protein L11 methyltransferase
MPLNLPDDAPRHILRLQVPEAFCAFFEESLGDIATSSAFFEVEEGTPWRLELYCVEMPEEAVLVRRLASLAQTVGIAPPAFEVETLPEVDWVTENLKSFKPISIGRFWVHGSHHHATPVPEGLMPIHMDAGLAFGSGEHATTSGCIHLLDRLAAEGFQPRHALDMGCGSGILAIAMAKLWPTASVLGVEIDPVAVPVACANAVLNSVSITIVEGDGYAAPEVGSSAPFSLVTANILANPLIAMAPLLAETLEAEGYAILSGFLDFQVEEVLAPHQALGFTLVDRIQEGAWVAALLRKSGAL